MQEKRLVRISKYLAKHLRHEPDRIGIRLDAHGWVAVDTLLSAAHGFPITREELDEVVRGNDKRRYTNGVWFTARVPSPFLRVREIS